MKNDNHVISDPGLNIDKYEERYIHLDYVEFPKILKNHLMPGPLCLVDLGSGDGPWFNLLHQRGYISESRPVYAVDLDNNRLGRIVARFPWINVIVGSAESVPEIPDHSADFIISTMVMEHILDENKYLLEIRRILKQGGKAFITTVYKRNWAWFYRRRKGEFVLDTSHVREYTDLDVLINKITGSGLEVLEINLVQLRIPIMKPIFRIWKRRERSMKPTLRLLVWPKLPVPGYYELELIVRQQT